MSVFKKTTLAFCLLTAWVSTPAWAQSGLQAALAATIAQHPSLMGKRSEVAAKSFGSDSARALRLPTLSGQLAAQDDQTNPGYVRLRQPLWAFGRIDSAINYADKDVLAEEGDLLRVKRQLIDQTAVAYAKVQASQRRLQIATENVDRLAKLHQQVSRREQGQLASMADVRLAMARWSQARSQKERYEAELTVARSELLALTQTPVDVAAEVPSGADLPASLAELEFMAESANADVLWRSLQVDLAMAEVTRESRSALPTVYLQLDRYLNQPAYAKGNRLSVAVEGALDNMGFAASGRSQAAAARMRGAADQLVAAKVEVRRIVQNLFANRASQQRLIGNQQETVAELAAILASYQRQYEAGQKAWLDVLNMQREWSDQLLAQAQAESDWLVYSLKLAALTGRLDALANEKKEP